MLRGRSPGNKARRHSSSQICIDPLWCSMEFHGLFVRIMQYYASPYYTIQAAFYDVPQLNAAPSIDDLR